MKMEHWKFATLLAVGVAADTYLDALSHSQNGGGLPPGVVFAEPAPHSHPQPTPGHNNYLPPAPPSDQQWFLPQSMKPIDLTSLIPIGISLATVLKVILKLLIFKMIVKFIAVMCTLLFLPKLEKEEQMTTTPPTTEKPEGEEEAYRILRAITTEPPNCTDGDIPCYLWKSINGLTRRRSTGKRSRLSMKRKDDKNKIKEDETQNITLQTK